MPKLIQKIFSSATLSLAFIVALSGCVAPQIKATTQTLSFDLQQNDLQEGGIAFITSSSITGQEEDKQAMVMAFTEILKAEKPNLRVITLAQTLSAINKAGLSDSYKRMLENYHTTGLFEIRQLQEIARLANVRYIAHLKLSGFRQETKNRLGLLGLRLIDTRSTDIRLFLQIWDSKEGSIAWEGAQELTFARDSIAEDTVTFRSSIEEAARQLIKHLP